MVRVAAWQSGVKRPWTSRPDQPKHEELKEKKIVPKGAAPAEAPPNPLPKDEKGSNKKEKKLQNKLQRCSLWKGSEGAPTFDGLASYENALCVPLTAFESAFDSNSGLPNISMPALLRGLGTG